MLRCRHRSVLGLVKLATAMFWAACAECYCHSDVHTYFEPAVVSANVRADAPPRSVECRSNPHTRVNDVTVVVSIVIMASGAIECNDRFCV